MGGGGGHWEAVGGIKKAVGGIGRQWGAVGHVSPQRGVQQAYDWGEPEQAPH